MRLPPLNALRAFEAAARHGGYIGAAEELHVSRGAISRHVKLLEDHLGVALFLRRTSGIELTPAGESLLPVLSDAFQSIAAGAESLRASETELRVLCPPATSIRWLMPRLGAFRAAHPEIHLQITTDFTELDGFNSARFDLGFSVENYRERPSDIMLEPLMPVLISPACAPSLLNGKRVERPSDLDQFNILHEGGVTEDWRDWAGVLGLDDLEIERGDRFHNLDMAVSAAVMGAGVMMGDLVLCRPELSSGALVLPLPDLVAKSSLGRFALLGHKSTWDAPKVRLFREWVLSEAEAEISDLSAQGLVF